MLFRSPSANCRRIFCSTLHLVALNKTIPLILCSEEDVKGSHGASIGELPQDILFYFASRGIEKETAEKIISRAKLETLCQGLDEKTADLLQKTIDEVIPT